jgi:hypothetical protein
MNALLLALAAAGALVVMATAPGDTASSGEELGSMTCEYSINPETGELEETAIIAFAD